ncbi:calcium-translocating P-type ATPase, PMCA-type [Fulvivirga sp. 29W222]|uniref:Calcium-translocating P-type ATPase, PMCA-type n=1 Tax=Fulvivirga marina TaxID=2494733 RepID=A0A937G0U0_9BACT|nr:calcium-translocating P-type ATPase, PMCA-type [Fulvivirga marina]MBL6448071.1 calcium-translocating P-type ATPase, PMCA-type [Fulvivirga marina]
MEQHLDTIEPKTVSNGLTTKEARKRLLQTGRNELLRTARVNPLKILLSQFTSPLILVLIAAAFISLAVGFFPGQDSNTVDALLILIIVFLSGVFGFIQDYEAEKTIEALQKMAVPKARVIRDGKETEILSAEVVPGDLLLLEPGDMVTADCQLLETFHLQVDESVLTGESIAIHKQIEDAVFANTYVTEGNAKALVEKTGMATRIGKVASKLQEMEEKKSSFQRELGRLGKNMSMLTLIIGIAIAVIGFFKFGFYNALLTAISLAVAAIPEGLPAVVVLALAVGARAMVRKNALIRKLSIVESVGAANVICTDKTGTLTQNEMTVVKLYYDGKQLSITADMEELPSGSPTLKHLLKCGILCNNSSMNVNEDGERQYFGEQTEIALRKVSEKYLAKEHARNFKKVNEISFSSERKMMSVVMVDETEHYIAFTKGAPEVLLQKCDRIAVNGEVLDLTKELKQELMDENARMAKDALRVLGFAYKPTKDITDGVEENLIWIGLQGMIDPPREEVKQALFECKTAGIRVVMITGDNPMTAGAIARQVGLDSAGEIDGAHLDKMKDEEIEAKLNQNINIFARTNPFHKLRILEALEKNNNVAMTGDGVNDALAIKKASVGISMGKKGTEVAKQASDIVLLDDNFSTIKEAIKEGRTIFNNIRKFINYLLTCNFAEVAVIFLSTIFFSLEDPILFPVQLLWVNLLTDGLVALALGVDPPASNIMKLNPRKRNEPIINKQLGWLIGAIGIKKTAILLLTFFIVMQYDVEKARTALFTGFILYEFVRIGSIRYMEKLTWFSNKWLLFSLFGSLLLQLLIIYTPLNQFFYVEPLMWQEWGILLGGCIVGFVFALPITRIIVKWIPD